MMVTTNRRGGKTVALIRSAVDANGVILTISKANKEHIISTAIKMGVKPPKVIVYARGQEKGITIAGVLVDHQDDCFARPWMDARNFSREFELKKITAKDLVEAVEKMRAIPVHSHYIFRTEWVTPYVSEEECIKYFTDNCAVVVYDSKGNAWHKGRQIYLGMQIEQI